MIWVLLGILLFGTGGSGSILNAVEEVRGRVSAAVEDDERRELIDGALDQFVEHVGEAVDVLGSSEQGFAESLRRKDAPRAELMQHITAARGLRRRVQVHMLDLREALRFHLTAEEWPKVFPPPPAD